MLICVVSFFFFNDTATTEIYTLSLHDALPICRVQAPRACVHHLWHRDDRIRRGSAGVRGRQLTRDECDRLGARDRKSTRLNSSHGYISYAVFCLKKKK